MAVNTICWYYDVRGLEDPRAFQHGLEILPWPDRREKTGKYRFEKDRRLCLGAGLLAACVLRQAGANDLRIVQAENGKPRLLAYPDLHFNLSHSGTLAVCVVSDQPVGVDVEEERDIDLKRFSRCFQPEELAWINGSGNSVHAFFRLWTRKESYLKRTGTGLLCDPASFACLPASDPAEDMYFSENDICGHHICVSTSRAETVLFKNADVFNPCL